MDLCKKWIRRVASLLWGLYGSGLVTMALNFAPLPRRQLAYAQLCRRWFAHYPDPFLAATTGNIAGMALAPGEEKARLKWLADSMHCGGDIVRGYSRQSWPMPSSLYWQALPLQRYWRASPVNMDRQQARFQLCDVMIAAASSFNSASASEASRLLQHLPGDIPNPRVLLDVDGYIIFQWQGERGQAVVVTFVPNAALDYQYMSGDDNPSGRYPRWKGMIDGWNPGWPQGIVDVLRVLYGQQVRH